MAMMEKPSATHGYGDRRERDRNDRRITDRLNEARFPAGASDEGDSPAWRGDHTFSPEAAAYSLTNFIEPDVKTAHPSWTAEQVRSEALRKFERRLSQDMSYERRESAHEETTVRWEVIETSPGVRELATEYGDGYVTLRQLWDHTREFAQATNSPGSYNAEEARVQLAMQDEFIRGSNTAFVSALSHPDAVRYVQIWEKSGDAVTSRQIDLHKTTGRDFSREESETLIRRIAEYHDSGSVKQSSEYRYAHLSVTRGTVSEADVKTIAIAQTVFVEDYRPAPERNAYATGFPPLMPDVPGSVPTVLADTVRAGSDIVSYIRRKLTAQPDTVSVAPTRKDKRKPDGIASESVTAGDPVQTGEPGKEDVLPGNPTETAVIAEWITASVARERAVFLPVGPVALMTLLTEPRAGVTPKTGTTESVRIPARSDVRETETAGAVLTAPENPPERIVPETDEPDVPALWALIVAAFSKNGRQGTDPVPTDGVRAAQPTAQDVHPSGEKPVRPPESLIGILAALSALIYRQPTAPVEVPAPVPVRKTDTKDAVTEHTGARGRIRITELFGTHMPHGFGQESVPHPDVMPETDGQSDREPVRLIARLLFSVTFWLLLSQPEQWQAVAVPDTAEPEAEPHLNNPARRDVPPWVLLSVIRHLAMLRESGKSSRPLQKNRTARATRTRAVSKQGKKKRFPDSGVIFPASVHGRMDPLPISGTGGRVFSYG